MATKKSRFFIWPSLCVLAACSDMNAPMDLDVPRGHDEAPATTSSSNAIYANPLAGHALYVQPKNRALTTAEKWALTRPADAALLEGIGQTAQAVWFGGWNVDVTYDARRYTKAAAGANALPVLVAYNIPQRDCGSYSAGGSASADAYRTWIRALAAGIGARRAVVILEPDALAGMGCLSTTDRERRVSLLAEAIAILKANAATVVYLDAGHARWISASEMARRLTSANIAQADGFSLNVSNFIWNSETVNYGSSLSALVGGKHFVIDTSRNGQGPTATNEWCNPSGRGLGVSPTTTSGNQLVDALLWIKRPGESDGTCNGGPSAGAWWPAYALGLAQRATTVIALN
jgi:endoglucanase